jgi:hypothetical protein
MGAPVGAVVALAGVAVAAGVAVVGALAVDGVAVGLAAFAGVTGATAVLAGGLGAGGVVGLAAALAGGCTVGAFAAALFKKRGAIVFWGDISPERGLAVSSGRHLRSDCYQRHLPPKQPKAPVAGPVPSTLHIESCGGELCKNFNVAETTDAQGRRFTSLPFQPHGPCCCCCPPLEVCLELLTTEIDRVFDLCRFSYLDFRLRHGLNASWHSKAIHLSFLDRPRICLTPNSGDDGVLQQVQCFSVCLCALCSFFIWIPAFAGMTKRGRDDKNLPEGEVTPVLAR